MAEFTNFKREAVSPEAATAPPPRRRRRETHSHYLTKTRKASTDLDDIPSDNGSVSAQQILTTPEFCAHTLEIKLSGGFEGDESHPINVILRTMKDVARGHGILEETSQSRSGAWGHSDDSERIINQKCFSATRRRHGHTPLRKAMLDIKTLALECAENRHPESSWEMLVYAPLLQQSLEFPPVKIMNGLVSSMPCSSANLMPEYLYPNFSPSKIDFCLFLQPEEDHSDWEEAPEAINWLRAKLPGDVINVTNFPPLRHRPIALPIACRKLNEKWESTLSRIGTWHATHWDLLERMADLQSGDEDTLGIPFLAAVLIHQHDWYLVVSTHEGERTTVWPKFWFGTTKTLMGAYQIVLGMQVLRNWIRNDYWPLLKEILGVGADRSSVQSGISS